MALDKQSSVPDNVVSSIFSRPLKKRVIDSFISKKIKPVDSSASQQRKVLPVGVDIGTNFIKILRISQESKTAFEIEKIIIKEIPREAQDDPKQRAEVLPGLLKSIVEENNLQGDCFACLPHNMSKVSLITLPQMSTGEIDKALRWEIRQSMQADINEVSLDYIPLEHQKTVLAPNQMGILTVSAPKKEALQYLALLNSAGLNTLALDAPALTNFAALEYTQAAEQDKTILFLDFGASQATMNIINNGELVFTRQLNISGNLLTKAISEYCKLSWAEAESLKKNPGLSILGQSPVAGQPLDKLMQVKNAILPLLENMVQDIESASKYFFLQVLRLQASRFYKLILCGGASSMNSLAEFLSSRLGITAQVNDPLAKFVITDTFYRNNPARLAALSPSLNAALGLALRGL